MAEHSEFQPQWASPPGGTILDILDERGMSIEEFCSAIKASERQVSRLITGESEIDEKVAYKLQVVLGGSAAFWLRRDAQFRSGLARLSAATESVDCKSWLSSLPVRDIMAFGWVPRVADRVQQVAALLDFFDTPTLEVWNERYRKTVSAVAYRTSASYSSEFGSLAAWLRQGEVEAEKINCQKWSKEALWSVIPELRKLTTIENPSDFIPMLQSMCAACGVAVVVVRAPSGCRASGATRFLSSDKALVQLSFRFRSDDHFWFTLFHELGHLLLHDCSSIFLEDNELVPTHEEDEANEFSASTLIPLEYKQDMLKLPPDYRKIMRFAKRVGVSYGIVVGQMQHHKILPRNKFNKLKSRYVWPE